MHIRKFLSPVVEFVDLKMQGGGHRALRFAVPLSEWFAVFGLKRTDLRILSFLAV